MALIKSIAGNEICDQTCRNIVNNISIGGRNLYTGTADFSNVPNGNVWVNADMWAMSNTSINYQGIKKDARRYVKWGGLHQRVYLPIGTYTLSAYLSKSGGATDFDVRLYLIDNDVDIDNNVENVATVTNNGEVVTSKLTNQYVRYHKTFNVTKAGIVSARFEKSSGSGSDTDTTQLFCVTALKLESGNKATDWSPAPEDICAMTDDGNGNVTIGIY